MSYNTQHNIRRSGRFNKNLVSSEVNYQTYEIPTNQQPAQQQQQPTQPARQQQQQQQQTHQQQQQAPAGAGAPQHDQQQNLDAVVKMEDASMAAETSGAEDSANDKKARLPFFRTKLVGVKKITNKERRRRQNQLLRRLTSPKNALMCINEMLPHDQIASQFKVMQAPAAGNKYCTTGARNFYAELTLDAVTYSGYGENKLAARNAAAEQAIRDIMLKKMERLANQSDTAPPPEGEGAETELEGAGAGAGAGADGGEEEGEALPMIQLLSFALHKLLASWETAGHNVPHYHRRSVSQGQQSQAGDDDVMNEVVDMGTGVGAGVGAGVGGAGVVGAGAGSGTSKPKKERKIPENATAMHPSTLLTMMRPQATYRELSVEGDKPQNMVFTMAVDIDEQTYVGKASNKKEARKCAARAACRGILGITFDDELEQ